MIVIGYDLGMNTAGGYGQYIRVPANWAVKMPAGLDAREAMIIGTAGFTAALCVDKIEQMGAQPSDGPVVVTGATGGVGSVAVALLAKLGYDVVASSGKAEKDDYLKSLGAGSVISRADLSEENKRPMAAETWAHGIDTVGGEILSNVIKGLKYSGSVGNMRPSCFTRLFDNCAAFYSQERECFGCRLRGIAAGQETGNLASTCDRSKA